MSKFYYIEVTGNDIGVIHSTHSPFFNFNVEGSRYSGETTIQLISDYSLAIDKALEWQANADDYDLNLKYTVKEIEYPTQKEVNEID